MTEFIKKLFYWVHLQLIFVSCTRSVYIVYTILGDVSIYVVGKDEYDELACKYFITSF